MTTENGQAKSTICHFKRSEVSKEVSKNANANVQNPLDISVSYRNLNMTEERRKQQFRHCERIRKDSRGNP